MGKVPAPMNPIIIMIHQYRPLVPDLIFLTRYFLVPPGRRRTDGFVVVVVVVVVVVMMMMMIVPIPGTGPYRPREWHDRFVRPWQLLVI
jgi:hypothetical protein